MEELDISGLYVHNEPISTNAIGTPITSAEVADRLNDNLYTQLSDDDDNTTLERIKSAEIYVGSILRKFGVKFDLDVDVIREIVVLNTIYEMHIAHGHEEAGREYRSRAKDIILVTWGDFKDSENSTSAKLPTGAVVVSKPSRYSHAFQIDQGRQWDHRRH